MSLIIDTDSDNVVSVGHDIISRYPKGQFLASKILNFFQFKINMKKKV